MHLLFFNIQEMIGITVHTTRFLTRNTEVESVEYVITDSTSVSLVYMMCDVIGKSKLKTSNNIIQLHPSWEKRFTSVSMIKV